MLSSSSSKPGIVFSSDHSLLVTFGIEISHEIHLDVRRLTLILLDAKKEGVLNIHPAYSTVLITFDPRIVSFRRLEEHLSRLLMKLNTVELPRPRSMRIPVCYEGDFAPDLAYVGSHNGLTPDEVIQKHSSATYTVYFLGFSPGFPYLGGMLREIATPRLDTPRLNVAPGSVGIAGEQTGVYPLASPGGWQLIGRTPLLLFDPQRNPPTLLQMGDEVCFEPISRTEYEAHLAQYRSEC
jgi:inhibitor of KinA